MTIVLVLPFNKQDDCVFKFSVSTKEVSFHIYNLRSFDFQQFKIHFHVWGNGGPHSTREQPDWEKEEEGYWTLVKGKHSTATTYAHVVRWQVQEWPLLGLDRLQDPR